MGRPVRTTMIAGVLAAVMIPPLVFAFAGLGEGMSFGDAIGALVAQYGAARQNLLVLSGVGLLPIGLLAVVLLVLRRLAPGSLLRPALALGGVVPILVVLVWAHWDFWPIFLPSRTYPGFPHGLGFVIGPLFFAPVGMVLGMLTGWVVAKRTA